MCTLDCSVILVVRLASTIESCIASARKREDVHSHALYIVYIEGIFKCFVMYREVRGDLGFMKLREDFGMDRVYEGVVASVTSCYPIEPPVSEGQ